MTIFNGSPTLLCPTDAIKLAQRLQVATIQRIAAELEQQKLESPVNVMLSPSELWLLEVFGMTLDFESGFVLVNEVTL